MAKNTTSPVGGIAGAVASVVGSISNIFVANKQSEITYQQWLNSATPGLVDYFDFEQPKDNSKVLIVAMSAILALIIIAIIVIRGKSS
jgi:preprotein translocase subunit Sec61beta